MIATFNNWPLSRKMLIAFSFIAFLLIAVAATGIVTNNKLGAIAERHVTRGLAGFTAISNVRAALSEQRIIVYARHNATDQDETDALVETLEANQASLVDLVTEFRRVAGAGLEADVDGLEVAVASTNAAASQVFAARAAGVEDSLELINGADSEAFDLALAITDTLSLQVIERAEAGNRDGKTFTNMALTISIVLSGSALAGLTAIWLLIGRTVAAPMAALARTTTDLAKGVKAEVRSLDRGDELGQIARAVQAFNNASENSLKVEAAAAAEQSLATVALGESLRAMSDGDLTVGVTADFAPAYAALKSDLNQALESLSGLIGSVGEGVGAIHTGSVEIAQASEDLARRTESNAASLEETSGALVQIEARLRTSAIAAKDTVARADQAIASVGTGRITAEGAMQAMSRVSSSAKGIDAVIEGVDKIAFQTRVLAMNAAVEAGRAGDAGRGFAVVADLVSALAMRAEEEAKRARDQLTVTQAEIITAVDAVKKVDGALLGISGDVNVVHELLASMADDNLAQSAAITQISSAVSSMDRATQQNAAMVEETSAAARSLTAEVVVLAEQAGRFRTGSNAHKAATVPAPRPKPGVAITPVAKRAQALQRAANDPPRARANGHASLDANDWSDF